MTTTAAPQDVPATSKSRVTDRVVTALLDAMVDGRLPAGQRLPAERELAAELQVNRASLRQAIGRLQQMGMLEARQGHGTVVCELANSTDPMVVAHLIERDQRAMLTELFEVREAMAGLIGRLAALRASGEDRRTLRALRDQVTDSTTAVARQQHELAFFGHLVTTTANRPLTTMQRWVDRAYGDAAELFTAAFTDGRAVSSGLSAIVDAIDAADPVSAGQAATNYAADSAQRMLRAIEANDPTGAT